MNAKIFGNFIARCRKEIGMTQAQLAEKLNVTDKAVSRWERGVGFPDISTLEPLACALEMSVLDIMKSEEITVKETTNSSEKTFGLTGSLFWQTYRVSLTASAMANIPEDMKKHVENGGGLYLVKLLDDDNAIISISKQEDDLHTVVDRHDVITKLRKARADVIATYPKEMQEYMKNGGRLYMIGYPKDTDKEVTISTSKDPGGYTLTVKYLPWSCDEETDFAKIGARMMNDTFIIRRARSEEKKKTAAYDLRNYLVYCTTIKELDELTSIYRDKVNEELVTGYEPAAIWHFVNKLCMRYPSEKTVRDKYLEHRNRIYAEIGAIIIEFLDVIRNDPDSEYFSSAVKSLRLYIEECFRKPGMKNMVAILKDKVCDNDIGYDLDTIETFANALLDEYGLL